MDPIRYDLTKVTGQSVDTKTLEEQLQEMTDRDLSSGGQVYNKVKDFVKNSVNALVKSVKEHHWISAESYKNEQFRNDLGRIQKEVTNLTNALINFREDVKNDQKTETALKDQMDYQLSINVGERAAKVYFLLGNLLGKTKELNPENEKTIKELQRVLGFVIVDCKDHKDEDIKEFAYEINNKLKAIQDRVNNFHYEGDQTEIIKLKERLNTIIQEIKEKPSIHIQNLVEEAIDLAKQAMEKAGSTVRDSEFDTLVTRLENMKNEPKITEEEKASKEIDEIAQKMEQQENFKKIQSPFEKKLAEERALEVKKKIAKELDGSIKKVFDTLKGLINSLPKEAIEEKNELIRLLNLSPKDEEDTANTGLKVLKSIRELTKRDDVKNNSNLIKQLRQVDHDLAQHLHDFEKNIGYTRQ